MTAVDPEALAEKIRRLPSERIAEVADFVDFLRQRDGERALSAAAGRASAPSLAAIWSNSDDDVYDAL